MLNKKQLQAKLLFEQGYNLFISGSAGTGKSFMIKLFKDLYESTNDNENDNDNDNDNDKLIITSTTGISSLNISGITIHSWSGIKPDTDFKDVKSFVNKIKNSHKIFNNYLYTSTLIIDEISMLSGEILEFINNVCKSIRESEEPFGGIQLILIGDFYQLPPVTKSDLPCDFSFNTNCWNEIIDYTIILDTCYRQKNDTLIDFLNTIRLGQYNDTIITQLDKYTKTKLTNTYTHLYPNKHNVNQLNIKKLNELEGKLVQHSAKIISKGGSKTTEFPKDSIISEHLMLKKGALVIINKNIDMKQGLVNGKQCLFESINSNGQLTVFIDGIKHNLSKQRWEFPNYYIEQYPICLAWALTIHKSQGMGIDYLSVDIGSNIFNDGQAYVALSRATNPEHLHIKNYDLTSIRCNQEVKDFYKNIEEIMNKWKKETSNNKIYYINICNAKTTYTLPTDAEIVSENIVLDTDIPNKDMSSITYVTLINPCKVCNTQNSNQNYKTWYCESICTHCIIKDRDFIQLSKTELYEELDITKKLLDEITKKCRNKPEKNPFNPRFKRIPLYLLGHIKKYVPKIDNHIKSENIIKLNNTNTETITKNSSQSYTDTTNKPSNTGKPNNSKPMMSMDEKIKFTYSSYFIENKSIKEISLLLNYSKATIENYIYRAYASEYDFPRSYLDKLEFNEQSKTKIIDIVEEWKNTNNSKELPKLKYIKQLVENISYLVIKLVLYDEYKL